MEIKGIQYTAPFFDNSGYAQAARGNVMALYKLGIPLTINPMSFEDKEPELGEVGKILKSLVDKNIDYNINVIHSTPEFWSKYRENDKKNIGYTIWETTQLHHQWSGYINENVDAVKFAQVVLQSQALPWASSLVSEDEHFLQLAGGTNAYTAEKLADEGLLSPASVVRGQSDATQEKDRSAWVHGLAFGGFARMEVDRIMSQWGLGPEASLMEAPPDALLAVLRAAFGVVRPIKKR